MEKKKAFRVFDIVKTYRTGKVVYGMVTAEVNDECCVEWFDNYSLENAWWKQGDVVVVGNVHDIIVKEMNPE